MDEAMERADNFLPRVDRHANRSALEVDSRVVAVLQPASVAAEQYRVLHQRLERLRTVKPLRSVALTSAVSGEGKSMTAVNLALVAAAANPDRRVLLIDADLRRPRVHLLLGVEGRPGLAEVLEGDCQVAEAMRRCAGSRLNVLPAGARREESALLVTSPRMRRLLEEASEHFDEIYVDAPPVLAVADGSFLAGICEGTVLVVRAGVTSRQLVVQAMEALAGTALVGCVLNGVDRNEVPYLAAANPRG